MHLATLISSSIILMLTNWAYAHKCERSDPALFEQSEEYKRVALRVGALFQCINTSDSAEFTLRNRTACNWFVSKAVEEVYGNTSLKPNGNYLSANEIAQKLASSEIEGWSSLGAANVQSHLDEAASRANQGKATLAVMMTPSGVGHVSLILPGGVARSESWKLNVPNSANLSLDDINLAYLGCRLSYAFGQDKMSRVVLYSAD